MPWYALIAMCMAVLSRPATAADAHPAEALIARSTAAIRTDPELSKREAEAALATLVLRPDADLEIRARLLMCDYLSERDLTAAEQQAIQTAHQNPRQIIGWMIRL